MGDRALSGTCAPILRLSLPWTHSGPVPSTRPMCLLCYDEQCSLCPQGSDHCSLAPWWSLCFCSLVPILPEAPSSQDAASCCPVSSRSVFLIPPQPILAASALLSSFLFPSPDSHETIHFKHGTLPSREAQGVFTVRICEPLGKVPGEQASSLNICSWILTL